MNALVQILIAESDGFSPEALARLRAGADVITADLDREGLLAAIPEADVLWVRLRNRIDAEVMAAAPRLRCIVTATTGLNHIDLAEAQQRGIIVLSLQGQGEFLRTVRATAEHTLALALALVRKLPPAAAHVAAGGWDRDRFKGNELYGKTAGIVGYGRLGRIVAQYFVALGMEVLGADPNVDSADAESSIRLVGVDELLSQSDLVSLHVNLCDETEQFFGRREFGLMKSGAWFVNTARGELIDEAALLEGLRSGALAGAALDVISNETAAGCGSHPLVRYAREHENLLLTPHIGGCTVESIEKTEIFLADKVAEASQAGSFAPGEL